MIIFENIAKTFRRNKVLENVNLQINTGERVALVGSNGAGKTTLIRCLLGEYLHDGKVTVDGLSPRKNRSEVLKRIGFVPQLPPPVRMPVGQLIRFAAAVCGSDPANMHEIAGQLGLDDKAIRRQPFNKLSGGQKQKLLIAIALGRECDVLVLDEPAANLDPEARHTLFGLLAERQDQVAMLISSHRLDEVAALVNRVIELDLGKVVLDDHVADQVGMSSLLDSKITLTRPDSAFASTVREWGFKDSDNGAVWSGQIAGPDRLRFLGVLTRYAGVLKGIHLEEKS
ncbi:MAG TPA: ABC transporter ATP-binding protein [Chromatiales bacterium]|nr:ABC transporter ATP-binding protein [Thiotrichales bacterium]HIP67058.1 ABC transporter ATP-binding protein [Chromatiales bacterium]